MVSASANYRGIQYLLIATTCLALNDACNKFVIRWQSRTLRA